MSWKIGMPNLGHTMEEGTVSEWLKAVGDPVRQGEVIAIVESDKASFDVESPADGVLIAIEAHGGVVVPVGATIGVVGAPGEVFDAQPAPPTGRSSDSSVIGTLCGVGTVATTQNPAALNWFTQSRIASGPACR